MAEAGDADSPMQQAPTVAVSDVTKFASYLRRVVPGLLADAEDARESFAATVGLSERTAVECMKRFIGDSQIPVLLIQRLSMKDENETEGTESDDKETVTYSVSSEVNFLNAKATSVVVIKRGLVVEADKNFTSQLCLMNLSDGSPYETLHSYVSNAIAPLFKSFLCVTGKADRDGDKMAPSVEKKMEELDMGLLHLQQNIDIPEITLQVHPVVAQVIKKCAEEGTKPKVSDFGDKVDDKTFLNALQRGVNRWIREIQKVTKLDRDPSSGTALQEISFWLGLERALQRIQEKRDGIEVTLTLDVLKQGKRFHATVSFDSDTGLKPALAMVADYNPLMKDFPLNDLLSATEFKRIRGAIVAIFAHLKKIRNTKYPIQRALRLRRLVEAISRDLSIQLLKVLSTRKLIHIPFDEFEKVMSCCFEIFATWDDEYEKLQALLRDIVKKKKEDVKLAWKVNPRLQMRLQQIRKFRRQHEQLRQVIVRVLRPATSTALAAAVVSSDIQPAPETLAVDSTDSSSIDEVNRAYDTVKEVDSLGVSKEGTDAWEAALRRYDELIDRVETRITARLRVLLGTARNANEMFRIFSRFNALFVRPHIRGAIREYQTQLIQRVKDDIRVTSREVQENAALLSVQAQYPQSQACHMSRVRDLPPVSGSIMWARQIERQLDVCMRRVEDVLGEGWEYHVDGNKLKTEADSFKLKLNTQEVFEDWSKKVQAEELAVSGRIFGIESVCLRQMAKGDTYRLEVNFLPEVITLAKEVRNLKGLGFRVPWAIVNKAHQASQIHPFAISLIDSVRTYERTCDEIEEFPSITLLVSGMRRDVRALISEGFQLVWDSYKLESYVQRLATTVYLFQERVDDILNSSGGDNTRASKWGTNSRKPDADAAKVRAYGDGLSKGETGNLFRFIVDTSKAGSGALAVIVDGPSKVQLQCDEVSEGYQFTYSPTSPGDYLVIIKYAGDAHIPGSPFKAHVTGSGRSNARNEQSQVVVETVTKSSTTQTFAAAQRWHDSDASKVKSRGVGLQKADTNKDATFSIDTANAVNGMLLVGIMGPRIPCEEVSVRHIGSGQYTVVYHPSERGEHILVVKWGDQHIPGSPFHIVVQ